MTAKDLHEVHDDEKFGDIERAAGSQTEDGSPTTTTTSSDSVTIRSNPDATTTKDIKAEDLSHNATAGTATDHVTATGDAK
ncbi:multidrug resistance protein fnx1, partial [Colletotrichum salicis]